MAAVFMSPPRERVPALDDLRLELLQVQVARSESQQVPRRPVDEHPALDVTDHLGDRCT